MGNEKELFFVNIEEPLNTRRTILESSRSAIHLLQDFEKLNSIRKDKINSIHQLDSVLKEINSLSAKLKTEFPKIQIKKDSSKEKKETKKSIKNKSNIVKETHKKTELESLHDELAEIEAQLKSIS